MQLHELYNKTDYFPLSKTIMYFCNELNKLTKILYDVEIEEVIKLLKIALIRNQSAKKSFLIKAIS